MEGDVVGSISGSTARRGTSGGRVVGVSDHGDANRRAWDLAAAKYEADLDGDVRLLGAGGVSLLEVERPFLGDLSEWCGRAVHLQCSHGLDTLSLWNMGAAEVVGVDVSSRMLALAERKAQLLDAPARWIEADVLDPPSELDGTADLVYTGKGALPWVADLDAWGQVVARLLGAGGLLYLLEGHPLDWVWEPGAPEFELRSDGGDYFFDGPRVNRSFPASAVARAVPSGNEVPEAVEWQWTLGQIVTSVARAGLRVEELREHPDRYWPKYGAMPEELADRLPHSFSLLARKPS